jgi:hypothetical protein
MKLWVLIFLAAVQLAAQSTEIVRLQYQRAETIMKLIMPMIPKSAGASFDNDLKVITLSGAPDVVEMLASNIRRLDVAPSTQNIELTMHLLQGADSDANLTSDLAGVVKQLRATFPFKGYQLLDSSVHRVLDGKGGMLEGMVPGTSSAPSPIRYNARFVSAAISGSGGDRRITIAPFDLGTSYMTTIQGVSQSTGSSLRTDVEIREGQKVVIGRTSAGPGRETLFVVLSAKIVD